MSELSKDLMSEDSAEKKAESVVDDKKEKDSEIDTMSVEELSNSNEKPVVKASEKKAIEKDKKKKGKSKASKFWKKYRGLIIFLILLAIGAVIFFMNKKKTEAQEAMQNATKQEFALIERQDITDPISTTGTIKAKKTSTLYSALKDTKLTNVNFEVGDHVNEGDVVVTFSVDNINKNIQETLEDIATSRQKEALEAESRERSYLYTYGTESYSLVTAQEKVEQTLKELYNACDGYGDAKRELEAFNNDPENYKNEHPGMGTNDESIRSNLQGQVSAAYEKEQTCQKNYNDAVAALAEANRKATNDLASAENTYETGQLTAGDNTRKLERTLETYQESLEDYVVTAPISGIVTKVEVEEGNGFNGGNLMVIQDDEHLVVTTEIDEYDIATVEEGQEVVIKTDATGDDELRGVVAAVAPTSTASSSGSASAQGSSSSSVTYSVDIDVVDRDPRLRIGMSAKINIVTAEHTSAFVVPYSAINEDDDGNKYINVVDAGSSSSAPSGDASANPSGIPVVGVDGNAENSGKPSSGSNTSSSFPSIGGSTSSKRPDAPGSSANSTISTRKIIVTTGIEGDYYTEIFSDEISEGMQVVLTEKNNSSNDFDFMNMGGGPSGGMGGGPGGPM